METKSVEILNLAEAVRLAIRKDWTLQQSRGQRLLGYSEDNLQKKIKNRYPNIGTGQIFKTIYGYTKYNIEHPMAEKPRQFLLDKVNIILRFLYVDISVEAGWPEVTKTMLEFKGGKYAKAVEKYLSDDGLQKIQTILNEDLLVKAGAAPGESPMTQLLQLVLKTNNQFNQMENQNDNLKSENDRLMAAAKLRDKKANLLREEIARMKGALSGKSGDHSEVLRQIGHLQKILNSLH